MSATERAIKAQLRKTQAIQAMHFGAIEERARIIKLLEGKQLGCSCGCGKWLEPWSLIALIKGENE